MIKSIEMKNCATYPVEGVTVENCQRVNFFYGPNGSGKSTISNFMHNQTAFARSIESFSFSIILFSIREI